MNADSLIQAMNELPEDLIAEALETERQRVPVKRVLRTLLIAAVIAVFFSVTAYAAGGNLGSITSSARMGRHWSTLDVLPKAERMLGLGLTVPERFESGFVFADMDITYSDLRDPDGAIVKTYPEFYANYTRGDQTLILNVQAWERAPGGAGWLEREQDGTTLYCHSFTYKVVPVDYRETEEDTARKETGELMIAWGGDEVETFPMCFVVFERGGAAYALFSYDGLAMDELCAMAGEIIRMDE